MRLSSWIFSFILAGVSGAAQPPGTSIAEIESLIRTRDYDSALQATQARLAAAPGDYRVWTLKGIVLSLQGDGSKALPAFEQALKLSPNYGPALKGEVQLLYPKGDKRTIPLLEKILAADPGDATAHEMLGVLKKKAGDCQAAIEQFGLSRDAVDHHAESLEAYGDCLVQYKQFERAIPVFQELAALLPQQAYPKYDLAVVLVSAKQYQSAVDTLEPLLANGGRDSDVLSLASQAYEALGNTPKAVELLREAIVRSPATPDYYVAFATLCLDHDSFEVGIDMLNAGLQRLPDSAALYISRGLLYAQLAKYDNAEADFRRAGQLDSSESLSAYAGDLAMMERNDPDQALARVRSQLKSHPESPLLNLLLAKLLMDHAPSPGTAPFDEAMRAVLLAIKQKPDLVDARDLLAGMYMSEEKYDLAIDQSRRALEYVPSDEAATYHLVICLRHTGQKDQLPPLVKRLAELHRQSVKNETDRKRYRLVEQDSPQDAQAAPK